MASPKEAAAELYAYSRIDLNEKILPDKGYECRPSISANFKFTKAAIIIQWLRKLERDPYNPARARAVLDEFERLTSSHFQPEERSWLVDHIRKLMKVTNGVNAFMENRTISEKEIGSKGVELSEGWFRLALDDPNLVARAVVMHGAEMIYIIHEEMGKIGGMVGNAVFERGKQR